MDVETSNVGATNSITLGNDDNTSTNSSAKLSILVGGASAGDPSLKLGGPSIPQALIGLYHANGYNFEIGNSFASPWLTINTSSGNVGIGTTTPAANLHVYGSAATMRVEAAPGTGVALVKIKGGTSGDVWRWQSDSNYMGFYDETTASWGPYIQNNGNVGIGTTSPAGTLDVEGGTAASGNGTSVKVYAQNGQASGNTNGGNIVLMPGTANGTGTAGAVGIGSASPATGMKADIAGPVKVAGTGSEPCTASQVGAIRYNPSGNYFELCSYP